MLRIFPLFFVLLFLCAFGPADDADKPPPPAEEKQDDRMDNSDATINAYLDGTVKASYWVQVHANPEAGQYWQTKMEMAGMTMTARWQVAKVNGDTAVIENQNKMDSEFMMSDYVMGYKVDLSKDDGEANVTKAWIGKPGDEPKVIEIMEVPEVAGGDAPDSPEVKTKEFTDLELAGRTWSGTRYMTEWGSSWIADNGWFNGLVQSDDADGNVTVKLSAFGDDAKALMKWPEEEKKDKEDKDDKDTPTTGKDKDEPKKEGEKEDKKKDTKEDTKE